VLLVVAYLQIKAGGGGGRGGAAGVGGVAVNYTVCRFLRHVSCIFALLVAIALLLLEVLWKWKEAPESQV